MGIDFDGDGSAEDGLVHWQRGKRAVVAVGTKYIGSSKFI
uniref:Uncharacterized protein n=1 Tax=Arundo donax TaxID=35708 RepID=A0A0A9BHH1_ARUDO